MKGLESRTSPVLLLGLQVILLAPFVAGSSWHLGCIHDNASSEVSERLLQDLRGNPTFSPSSCSRSCRDIGFLYAGLQGVNNCRCSNIIGEFGEWTAEGECNITCGNTSLPCGGDSVISIYSVEGPYLLTVALSNSQHLVQEGSTVRFEARVDLATSATVTDTGLEEFNISHVNEISFTWSVDGEQMGISVHRYGNSSVVDSFVHTFSHEGKWLIDVEVSNPVSSLARTTSITVVQPLPSDLQVILRPTRGETPSCVPVSDAEASPAVSAFVGEEMEFQASVGMGINLTFAWMFDEGSSDVNGTMFTVEEPGCEGIACMQDTQVHTYTSEGRYLVMVNVSNHLGSVQKELYVVVVNREIANLTMSLSSNSAFINKVNSSLGLLVTMTAAARQQVLLEVDFGDGSIFNHSMYDINDTFITVGDEDSAHLHLYASYGEGCTLFVSLSHRYRSAGVFAVEAQVFQKWNSKSVGSVELNSAVIVQDTLGPVQIETEQVYSTNGLANFSWTMPGAAAVNISFLWSVTFNSMTVNLGCQEEPTCLHNFTEPGLYMLNITVWNLVSTSNALETIEVQEEIRGLAVTGGRDGTLPTGTTVQFMSSIEAGSNVQFTWHFSDVLGHTDQRDDLLRALPTSQANHTFYTFGMHNVSVTASNLVSQQTAHLPLGILAQDPVLGLSLVSTGPKLLGNPTRINATLLQGTHIRFSISTEYGTVAPQVQHFEDEDAFLLEFVISSPGVFHVTVMANNSISSENATLCLVVQESIGTASIQEFHPGNDHMLLLARLDGEIPNRTDVMYTWLVRGENITSACPLLAFSVCLSAEVISVQASNQVDASYVQQTVDSSTPQAMYTLDCPAFGEAGSPVLLSLQILGDLAASSVQVRISHGDSTHNTTLALAHGVTIGWNHTYSQPGVFLLDLGYSGAGGEDIRGTTAIVIQRQISHVELTGPTISKFFGSVATQTWEVRPASGTDILYTWTIRPITTDYSHGTETDAAVLMPPIRLAGSHGKILGDLASSSVQAMISHGDSTHNTTLAFFVHFSMLDIDVSIPFYAPGHYNITLQASNLISSVTIHSETILQQPIIRASVSVEAALLGMPSTYQIIIKGGPPFQFAIDFGTDGPDLSTTSEELAEQGGEVIDYLFDPPVCVYTMNRTYPDLGWYVSSFEVRNLISEAKVTATAKVEERISGLTLKSESPSLVAIGHPVVLTATVQTGNDVLFTWDFQDPGSSMTLQNCLNASIATHTFSRPGTYQVSVTASNFLQPQPLTVTLPEPFLVQEPPFALELRPPTGQAQGAPLVNYGDQWATPVLNFEAHSWGSHLVFYFDYGDGTVEKVDGVVDVYGSYNAAGSHRYLNEGNYSVSVTAGNQLNNQTQHLSHPYYVQVPPTSLRCQSPYSSFIFGNVSHLSVLVETGSNLFYNWSMGDQTDYIDVGPSVHHMYRSPGYFSVTVVAFNKVQKAQVTCTVSVEVQIQGVQLVVEKTLYQTYTHITLEAQTVTDSALWFQWDMGDQRDVQTTSINTLTYLYTIHGRYYITVLAGNHVSNATSTPIELTLQTAITSVTINAQSAALVGQTTTFDAWVFTGSDMNFVWDFGDGAGSIHTSALSIYHKYNRTGEFMLHLIASNLVSNSTAASKIFILTRMCRPPILDIVGDDSRTVKHSEDIRIEADVKIDCEITSLALYTWTVTYAGNGSAVELDPEVASLDQRTLFIPRRYLPYGTYSFALNVAMNGTIVYAHDSVNLQVVRSSLMSIIEGGTRRYFSRDMMATLNGSFSFDPDNPNDANLSYTWTCHPLNLPTAPCFNATTLSLAGQSPVLPSSNSSIIFPTSWLLPNGSLSFVFTLRVGKEGRKDSEVTQVLSLEPEEDGVGEKHIQVSVDCHECEDGFVNANEELTLEAVCLECDENATYSWELYVVLDGTTSDSTVDLTSGRRCMPSDGSGGQYLLANDSAQPSPSPDSEEDTNVINQNIPTTSSSTVQNSVSNGINSGLVSPGGTQEGGFSEAQVTPSPVAGVDDYVEDIEDSVQGGSIGEDAASIFAEGISTSADPATNDTSLEVSTATSAAPTSHFEESTNSSSASVSVGENVNVSSLTETTGSFEEAGGSFDEGGGSFQEAANSFAEVVSSLAEAGGSFDEVAAGSTAGGEGSFAEAAGSFEEATGSLAEATGSLAEATGSAVEETGSFVEATGSIVETGGASIGEGITGSFQEAGGSSSVVVPVENTPGAPASSAQPGGSFQEAGGSFQEAGSSFQEAEGSLTETGASLDETGGSLTETGGSFAEAGGSFAEAGGSFAEADGSFAEAGGSFEEAGGSFEEAGSSPSEANDTTAVGSTSEELPGISASNDTDGSTSQDAEASPTEIPRTTQKPSINTGGDYEEALDSNYEDTASSAVQPSPNASQPVSGNDGSIVPGFPADDYYESYRPVEYLSSNDDPGLDPPSLPDNNNANSGNQNEGDPVIEDSVVPVINEHIVSKSRRQIVLKHEDTTTGLTGRALTIKDGVLEENRTYALVVTVQSREKGILRTGKAHQYSMVNMGPRAGLCFITPEEGIEMETIFTINCYGWQDNHTPLQYEVSYSLNETEDLAVLYFGMRHAVKFQLPAGYADNSHVVYVKVAIVDGQGGKTSVCSISIQVLPKTFGQGESVEEFLYNVTVAPANLLNVYVQEGDQHSLNGFISLAACILNRQTTLSWSGNPTYTRFLALRRQIRYALITACEALPMRDQFEIQQSAVATAASSYVPQELQISTILRASRLIDTSKTRTVDSVSLAGEMDVEILVALTSTVSSLVSALGMEHAEAIGLRYHKVAIERSLGAVWELLKTFLQLRKPDQEPLLIHTHSVDLLGSRQSLLANADLMVGQSAFILPSSIVQSLLAQNGREAIGPYMCHSMAIPCWDVDMISYQTNPFKWGDGAYKVTSGVSSLNLRSCTGHDLEVANLTAGREIVLEVEHPCNPGSLTCNLTIDKDFMNVHQFNVSDENIGQTFQIMVRLAPEARRTFSVKLIMRYGSNPTPTMYDSSWLYENEEDDLRIFLPPNTFNVSGEYYLALIDAEYGESYRQDEISLRRYLIRLWFGDCLYWNTNEDAWFGDGCTLMESSTYELTRCKCNHLTSFGVTFLPVTLFLDIVNLSVFERPNANPITYSFTAGILSIYVLLCIYCFFADQHDKRKQGLIYLWDNQPSDQQYYEITVETGMRAGAGTTARVSLVLHGEEGHSETKELICKGRPIFEKNSRDRFIASVPESLGNIQRVHVWHNNAGHSPSWFLSRLAVRDLITGQKWYFVCERWFAVEEDDGKIERELEVMDKGIGFQKAFFAKLFQYFADYYLWSSVFTRPPYSVFTRVQRLTCCLSISMGFLCINTIWYQHLDKEEVELGLIDVSGEAMLVGIVTALLAIPINFPVIMVFRRARPRCEEIEEEKSFRSVKKTIELPESAEPVETILNQGSLDSGVGEHPDVTLEDLQGWAKEKWKNRLKGFSNHSDNMHSSYDSFSFGSSSYDDALSTHSSSTRSSKHHGLISDSGVSSPDTHSLQSSYLSAFYQTDHKRLSNPKRWLPNWCGKLAWVICFLITVFSAAISIFYGYSFSNVKSVYWMQSVYFSFLQCIFVTQPAVMLMFTIMKSVRHKNNIRIFDHYDDNVDLIDKKSLERARLEGYENNLAKAIAARQRSRYLRFARPPQEKELQKAKEKMLKEKSMWAILKDVIMYSTLFTCLMWMAYGREVAYHHPVNEGIRQTYLQTPHPFTGISSVEDLWVWLNEDLVDSLYWDKWYNGESVVEEKNSIMNGESIILGRASLRQVRVRHHSCPIATSAQGLFTDCKSGYNQEAQSTRAYGPERTWVHSSKEVLQRYCKWGYFGSYEGDGFTVDLNNSREEAMSQLSFLQNNSWIDDQTRAVIVELTVYNAPTNLYTSVALLAEMPGTGAVNPLPKIESVLLYRYETVYDYFIMCCELLFLLLVAVSGMREVQKLVKIKAKFFKSTWSWMEMGMIVLSLAYFAMYVCRFMYVNDAAHHLRTSYREEFVDMALLAYWDQILKDLLASLIFLASVKFLRLLRFNQTVAMFGAVIDGAIREILMFALYMLLLEAAFACLGVLFFSTHFYPMKHLYISTNVLNAMVMGHPPHTENLAEEFPWLWHLFYFAYIVSMIIMMAGLIKAVLCHSYKQVKQRHIEAVGGKEVVCFFWNKFLIRVGLRKLPEEEDPTTLPTEFTMAEIEYQVDELLFRMSAISNQHGLPEKPYGYFEDSDGTHGMMDDGMSSTCSEMNLFDNARLEDRVQKIESQLYGHNPELRELLDGNCFTDEDREKQLRAHLEMEIFRQLQLQRQEEYRLQRELHDSGHDTQSTSEHMELGSDNLSLDQPPVPYHSRDTQGLHGFPRPMQNQSTLEARPSSAQQPSLMFTNRKQAWGQFSSGQDAPMGVVHGGSAGAAKVPQSQGRYVDNRRRSADALKRPHTTGAAEGRKAAPDRQTKPVPSSFVRCDPQLLSSSEVLDSRSTSPSSSYVNRTDSLSSHASDLVTDQVNQALSWNRSSAARRQPDPNLEQLVRDHPEGTSSPAERAMSVESFPLPNALDGLSSSSGHEEAEPAKLRRKPKESDARHRLRKTRSRGKGKGRRRYDEAVYVNDAFSTDSDEENIPVIQMGPAMLNDKM